MEDKIIIKLKDERLSVKVKKMRQAGINITQLFCDWLKDYKIPNKP